MKVLSLQIKNVGLIADETIPFDKALLIFFGEIRAGKSTILNSVRWVLGGEWPTDIIRHGEAEASITLLFTGGSVSRSWYRGKDNATKAREIIFIRDGAKVQRPASEIAKLLNPFIQNQDYLRSMSEPDRKAYFARVLAIDTADLDTEVAQAIGQAAALRAEIKAYGEFEETIMIPPTAPPDVAALEVELDMVKQDRDQADEDWRIEEDQRQDRFHQRTQWERVRAAKVKEIAELQEAISLLNLSIQELDKNLRDYLPLPAANRPAPPARIGEIELALRDAGATKAKYEQWEKDVARFNKRQEAEAKLTKLEKRQREIKEQKASMLKDHAANCGVPELAFDEAGQVVFEGITAGMLSTSQLMRLSTALAALYPPGFGLELIDRAESLGKSIYTLIDDAKARERTILATVVGDAPAQSPPEVGVFVVEAGKIKEQK